MKALPHSWKSANRSIPENNIGKAEKLNKSPNYKEKEGIVMKKRLLAALMAASLCASLVACGGSSTQTGGEDGGSSADGVTLRFNFVKSSTDPEYEWYEQYFSDISEASGGEIQYELYPSEALGGSADVLEMAAQGQAVVQDCDLSYLADYVPGIDAGMAPYLIQEPEQVVKLWKSEVGQEWSDALAEKGLHLIDLHYFGTRNLISDTEVHSREDMADLKIRCAATPMWNEVVRVLGGNATNTAWSETYQALSQGVADAAESPMPLLYSARLYEPCKYLIKTGHLVAATAIVMSEEVYQSLSPEAQEAIDSCADNFANEVVDKVLANEEEYEQMLVDEGVQVIDIDKTEFIEAAQETPEHFPDWPEGIYERVQEAIA